VVSGARGSRSLVDPREGFGGEHELLQMLWMGHAGSVIVGGLNPGSRALRFHDSN
jgi:hypothetical protein